MSQAEQHALHLIQHRLDKSCKPCLLQAIRSLEPAWRIKGGAGFQTSDSSLVREILIDYLRLRGHPIEDFTRDCGFATAFELLEAPKTAEEVGFIEPAKTWTPANQHFDSTEIELSPAEEIQKFSNTEVERAGDPGGKPVRKSLLDRLQQLVRGRGARDSSRL